jgi:prepilin-type N-terminal cleavage/methylation domain-containing protein/prepilin-type processing-associated H-X9-DG protein
MTIVQYVIMKRPGFTLIELLVVVAIIALLIALLVPVLRYSKQQAMAVACNSNIRQLVTGMIIYENENQTLPYGFYNTFAPLPEGYPGGSTYDRMGWWWFHFMDGFFKKLNNKTSVICCPSRQLKSLTLRNNILYGNYGVNRSICKSSDDIERNEVEFTGKPLGSNDIPQPAQSLLIVDSGYSIVGWWHVTDVPPVALDMNNAEDTAYVPGLEINKYKDLRFGQKEDAVGGRHPNKTVNVGFADGHSDRKRAIDLFVDKTNDTYTNKSPLWVPK